MSALRSIGFLIHPGEQRAAERAVARAQTCGFGVWTAVDDPEGSLAEHGHASALLVTVGGDGTFLYGARLAAPRAIPVLGVNRGRLGFLADVEMDDLPDAISRFASGEFVTQRRSLVEVSVTGPDSEAPPALALNEVVVRARGVNVVRLRVDADGDLLGEFDSDGVVVATATGSTAYALSAGGPPVDPRLRALVVVPLAPHAVISRPVVIPEAARVDVTVAYGDVSVAADGRMVSRLSGAGIVAVRPGPELALVRFADSPSFLERLREKFRFGVPNKGAGKAEASGGTLLDNGTEGPEESYGPS
jgi:NAD+ kinase